MTTIYSYAKWRTGEIRQVEVDRVVSYSSKKKLAYKNHLIDGKIAKQLNFREFCLTYQEAKEKVLHLLENEINVHERAISRLTQVKTKLNEKKSDTV